MLIQVEMPATETGVAEVLYALRVAPHLVRLRGIPNDRSDIDYDDLLLVDYQPQRYGAEPDNETASYLFPVLTRIEKSEYQTIEMTLDSEAHATEACQTLSAMEIPIRQDSTPNKVLVAVNAANLAMVKKVIPSVEH